MNEFAPTYEAARARIATISPGTYARTRNALDGAVTRLSPYLTHGIVALPEVAQRLVLRHQLGYADKLVFEFGWREFFAHVWAHAAQADDILKDMRPAQLWRGAYARELPLDVREGRTGVPCIDSAVRQLYATGYLHNHARMWLASYCVHLRKVHWRAGADWLYAHLLDGDLASNHLSWQWVAATFSSKPYLFNAENVTKYASPAQWKLWHSPKTVIDQSYEALDDIARTQADVGAEPGQHAGVAEPARRLPMEADFYKHFEPIAVMQPAPIATEFIANRLASLPSQARIELVTPWALSERSTTAQAPRLRIGVVLSDAHSALPWSQRRWDFVLQRMAAVCDVIWLGTAAQLHNLAQLPGWPAAHRVQAQATRMPIYRQALPRIATLQPAPLLFAQPSSACKSFSQFYERAQRAQPDFSKLLELPRQTELL